MDRALRLKSIEKNADERDNQDEPDFIPAESFWVNILAITGKLCLFCLKIAHYRMDLRLV